MNKTIRIISAMFFIIVIFILSIYTYINKDVLFTSVTIITYPDGCNETYYNGKLNNSICEYGRLLADQNANKRLPLYEFNVSLEDIEWDKLQK